MRFQSRGLSTVSDVVPTTTIARSERQTRAVQNTHSVAYYRPTRSRKTGKRRSQIFASFRPNITRTRKTWYISVPQVANFSMKWKVYTDVHSSFLSKWNACCRVSGSCDECKNAPKYVCGRGFAPEPLVRAQNAPPGPIAGGDLLLRGGVKGGKAFPKQKTYHLTTLSLWHITRVEPARTQAWNVTRTGWMGCTCTAVRIVSTLIHNRGPLHLMTVFNCLLRQLRLRRLHPNYAELPSNDRYATQQTQRKIRRLFHPRAVVAAWLKSAAFVGYFLASSTPVTSKK